MADSPEKLVEDRAGLVLRLLTSEDREVVKAWVALRERRANAAALSDAGGTATMGALAILAGCVMLCAGGYAWYAAPACYEPAPPAWSTENAQTGLSELRLDESTTCYRVRRKEHVVIACHEER